MEQDFGIAYGDELQRIFGIDRVMCWSGWTNWGGVMTLAFVQNFTVVISEADYLSWGEVMEWLR